MIMSNFHVACLAPRFVIQIKVIIQMSEPICAKVTSSILRDKSHLAISQKQQLLKMELFYILALFNFLANWL
jgi:hypothetical protein